MITLKDFMEVTNAKDYDLFWDGDEISELKDCILNDKGDFFEANNTFVIKKVDLGEPVKRLLLTMSSVKIPKDIDNDDLIVTHIQLSDGIEVWVKPKDSTVSSKYIKRNVVSNWLSLVEPESPAHITQAIINIDGDVTLKEIGQIDSIIRSSKYAKSEDIQINVNMDSKVSYKFKEAPFNLVRWYYLAEVENLYGWFNWFLIPDTDYFAPLMLTDPETIKITKIELWYGDTMYHASIYCEVLEKHIKGELDRYFAVFGTDNKEEAQNKAMCELADKETERIIDESTK